MHHRAGWRIGDIELRRLDPQPATPELEQYTDAATSIVSLLFEPYTILQRNGALRHHQSVPYLVANCSLEHPVCHLCFLCDPHNVGRKA